jgi:hypothetical protein
MCLRQSWWTWPGVGSYSWWRRKHEGVPVMSRVLVRGSARITAQAPKCGWRTATSGHRSGYSPVSPCSLISLSCPLTSSSFQSSPMTLPTIATWSALWKAMPATWSAVTKTCVSSATTRGCRSSPHAPSWTWWIPSNTGDVVHLRRLLYRGPAVNPRIDRRSDHEGLPSWEASTHNWPVISCGSKVVEAQ